VCRQQRSAQEIWVRILPGINVQNSAKKKKENIFVLAIHKRELRGAEVEM
jgi:hypothetical protein